MFSWLQRIFPSTGFFVFVSTLYIASWIYPFTRVKITKTLQPYQSELQDWGNVIVSLLVAMFVICAATAMIGILQALLKWIKDLFKEDGSYQYGNRSIEEGINLGRYHLIWIVNVLAFLNYIHITEPMAYWKNVFIHTAKVILPWLLKSFNWAVYLFAFGACALLLFTIVMIGWAERRDIQAKLKSVYEKMIKKGAVD